MTSHDLGQLASGCGPQVQLFSSEATVLINKHVTDATVSLGVIHSMHRSLMKVWLICAAGAV